MEGRRLGATVAAALAALGVLAVSVLAGYVLYRRLLNGSLPALAALLTVFAVVGAYAGWLIGLVVFSSVRGQVEEAPSTSG